MIPSTLGTSVAVLEPLQDGISAELFELFTRVQIVFLIIAEWAIRFGFRFRRSRRLGLSGFFSG